MKKFFAIFGVALVAIVLVLVLLFPVLTVIPLIIYSLYFPVTKFELQDNTLIMKGLISGKTPDQVYKIFAEHPDIDTIEMAWVEGSIDDRANLEIALWVAGKELTTKIGRYGLIASGGTDFFLAGQERVVVDGAQIGVHSWASASGTAIDYPRGHEFHQPYIDYYQGVGFTTEEAENFYYYTIEAAPAGEIHIMTNDEIIDYKLTTTGITATKFIVSELEEERKEDGLLHMTEEQAESAGIEVINKKEYKRRQKARDTIKLK
ncbi:MAG: hypothetical protein HAW61_05680 [Candidatus Portiera sp.]|nr:hypothetical protein [Portiera sp.]